MLYLARLIPLVEARTNSLELGQAGTGKSFVYEQASEFARVFLGQDISEAVLIYNEQNKQLGIIFNKDLICFDEVDKGKSSFRHIIPKLQQIMASNSVERGEFQAMTDISIVFQGNILFRESSGQREPTYSNFIEQHLPKEMQDVSFLDRIHLFIRGWELPTFSTDLKNKDIGLVYNYLGHIFHKFRKENVYDSIRERFQFFKRTSDNREVALSARDNTALRHIISGYVKLIFPDLQISDEELKMILKYAIKLRQNVINEIIKFDSNENRELGFRLTSETVSQAILEPNEIIASTSGALVDCNQEQISESPSSASFANGCQDQQMESATATIEGDFDDSESNLSEKTQPEQINIIFSQIELSSNGELLAPLPYIFVKYLKSEEKLEIRNGIPFVSKIDDFSFNIVENKSSSIKSHSKSININYDLQEEELKELRGEISKLKYRIKDYRDLFNNLNNTCSNLEYIKDSNRKIELNEEIDSIYEKYFSESIFDEKKIVSSEIMRLEKIIEDSSGKSPDIISEFVFATIENNNSLIPKVKKLIEKYETLNKEIDNTLKPIMQEVIKAKPAEIQQTTSIKQKHNLLVVDVNNIIQSYRKKHPFHDFKPLEIIKEKFLNNSYYAMFFASKHLENGNKIVPAGERVKWFIENKKKFDKNTRKEIYADIDTLLVSKAQDYIAKNKDSIMELTLFSGDKDILPLVDIAKREGISITVVGCFEENISKESKERANDWQTLYN